MTKPLVFHQPEYFVNRQGEIAEFEQLIKENRPNILLIRGPEGIGKSGLLHFLVKNHADQSMKQADVDFRLMREAGERIDDLIYDLATQLGEQFDELLEVMDLDLSGSSAEVGQEFFAKALAAELASMPETSQVLFNIVSTGGGAYVAGNVETGGGDFAGRDNITMGGQAAEISHPAPPHPDPAAGSQKLADKRVRHQNRLFKKALHELLDSQKVILFFDHCEEAEDTIHRWIDQELLRDYLRPRPKATGLRIVLVGRRVPWQEQAGNLQTIVSDRLLGGLSLENVTEYAVAKRGLPPQEIDAIMEASAGVPRLMLREVEKRLG